MRMTFKPDKTSIFDGVEKSFAWLDRLALIALIFTLSATIANFFNQSEVALLGITFPLWAAHFGLIALTIAHLFVMRHIIQSCADAWLYLSADRRNALFDHVVRAGGIMTKGAHAYRGALTESKYTLDLKTNVGDPPTWIHHILVLLTLLALVNLEWSLLALSQLCFALVIVIINWKIGENWLLCLGDLGSSNERSRYFLDGTARPRVISHSSGLIIGRNIGYRQFLFGTVMEAAFSALVLWVVLLFPFALISLVVWLIRSVGWLG
jgi:hypothetical protein